MKVLAITSEFPLPPDRGGPVRFLGLARALAKRHDVHLLARRRPNTTDALVAELESELGGPVEVFDPPPPAPGQIGRARRWSRAVASGVPPWVQAQYSPALERRAVELAPAADAVVLLDDYAGIYTSVLARSAPVIADKSEVAGMTIGAGSNGARGAAGARRSMSVWLVRRFEREAARHAAATVVTSEDEASRFARLYGKAPEAVVPSAMDLPEEASDPSAKAVGWLGTLDFEANVNGLVRFVESGWDRLGGEGYRLLVAGSGQSPQAEALTRHPGVELLGYVEHLDEFTGQLAAAVVPIWQGAGVKLKTLALMGAGVPVAATGMAVEGLAVEDGRHCMIAEEPAELGTALGRILEERDLGTRLAREGRSLVAERYTWDSVGQSFVDVVERTARR